MNNDENSALGKDVNNGLYAQDRLNRATRELAYMSAEKGNKIVQEVRQEMLEGEEINFMDTSVDDNSESLSDNLNTALVSPSEDEIEGEFLDSTQRELNTSVNDIQEVTESALSNGLQTSTEKVSSTADKVFSLATSSVGTITKTAKITNKAGGKLIRFGKNNLNVIDKEGNVDAINAGANQLKTFGKWSGRNFILKPAGYVGKKVNRKVTKKAINVAVKSIQKIEKKVTAKITAQLSKVASKAVVKIAQAIIKVISKIIQTIVELAITCLPAFIILLVLIIILIIAMTVFGGNMSNEQLNNYSTYMNDVQTSFQSTTQGYYNEGYKVEGTYNGTAYINWQAALSIVQSLQPELDGSRSELNLLDEMKNDGVMYQITEATTSEYVMKEEVKDEEGNVIQEAVKTTKKYVVSIGTLEDYKNWVNDNLADIKTFYNAEKLPYDANISTFLTTDLSSNIDTLYNSQEFTLLLDGAGITMGADVADGTIYDTGENSGVLSYPTTYHQISAGYPTYPSGKEHTGIDFPAPTGTPICACADGKVILVKELNYSYGKYVVLEHNIDGKKIYTLYAHNSSLKVSTGQEVKKGQVIAISGSTGNSTGPHCHLSVLTSYNPQVYVQPLDYL